MSQTQPTSRDKILHFLKRVAPFSVLENGERFAAGGQVTEFSRVGSKISGVVRESSEEDAPLFPVTLDILSGNEIEAACPCSSAEEMTEQWCVHAVALLVRACDLGFSDSDSGFASQEAVYRMNTSSPEEIASVIADLSRVETAAHSLTSKHPAVQVVLDHTSDRLGVKVLFDGEVQAPTLFEGFGPSSARELDNLLLRILDDEGSWDDASQQWFINSSQSIEIILGIVREYRDVISSITGSTVHFAETPLDARLCIQWMEASAELFMEWMLPDGTVRPKDGDLLGTGPYWTAIGSTLFRLTPAGARIASIFPYSSNLVLPRTRVGPLLAALNAALLDPEKIKIINPELQPISRVETPTPLLELERRDTAFEHFSSGHALQIQASLDFEYPVPSEGENLVYLPDKQKEREAIDLLKSLGFESLPERRRFAVAGDAALDLIYRGTSLFPKTWRVSGFDGMKKGLRFADLTINLSVSQARKGEGNEEQSLDWFDCHLSLVQNNANVPLSTLFKNVRSDNDRWVRLDSGAYARVPGGGVQQLKTTLGMLDTNFKLSNSIKTRLSAAQAVSFSRIEDEQITVALSTELKGLARKLRDFSHITPIKCSKNFVGKLRSYQLEGLSWLNFLGEFNLGGILADEMGLGKTVQTLALLQYLIDSRLKAKKLTKPALIVAPTSVVTNWLYEARRFAPKLKVLLLHGPGRKALFEKIPEHDLVITSYALLRLDRFELEQHEFGYIVVDEAQNIKNPLAATTRAAKALKAKHRLALTGTPTENRPLELWSIIDFLMPGYLGSLEFFKSYIEKPILEGGPATQVIKFLNAKTRPFILRRAKADVEKDLPPKIESTLHVEMTDSQRALYARILEEVRPRVFDAVNKKGVRGASVSILAALLRLRQVCNHPNSIDSLKDAMGYDSGKFNLLKDLLREALDNGRKVLLFGQFREMLGIIRRWLDQHSVSYLYLDGATRNRQELIDQFNTDESTRLFLISLKAGGTGLNLTAADTVVIYDPWWNPAVESQAVDRAHRIGQTKTVSVYRLVTEHSIEQKIMDLKERKSRLVDALINENGLSTISLSKADLENLFSPLPPAAEQ